MDEGRRKQMQVELDILKNSVKWFQKGFRYQDSANGLAECLKCSDAIDSLESLAVTIDKKEPKCFGNIGENPIWLKEKFGIEKDYCHDKCPFRRECLRAY